MKKIVIIGGGTFNHVACHLSLATPAFGTTARQLYAYMTDPLGFAPPAPDVEVVLKLTKMADHTSNIVTNRDAAFYLQELLDDPEVKAIVMNVALCDFRMRNPGDTTRLSSSENYASKLIGVKGKLIENIKRYRPDIFVVGFKTTAGATIGEQLQAGRKLQVDSKIDEVLANDVSTHSNILMSQTGYVCAPRVNCLQSIAQKCIDWCEQ
jgi:hypothetical protein